MFLHHPAGHDLNSALATMQAQRVVKRSAAAFFQNVAEAERWLFA